MNTPTPRTDEQINGKPCTRFAVCAGDSLRDALVPSEFARELERELADMTARAEAAEAQRDALISTSKQALAEITLNGTASIETMKRYDAAVSGAQAGAKGGESKERSDEEAHNYHAHGLREEDLP